MSGRVERQVFCEGFVVRLGPAGCCGFGEARNGDHQGLLGGVRLAARTFRLLWKGEASS